jgi:hypothetical protein
MIDITKDIQPLTTFRNNSVKTRRPIILTGGWPTHENLQSSGVPFMRSHRMSGHSREGANRSCPHSPNKSSSRAGNPHHPGRSRAGWPA